MRGNYRNFATSVLIMCCGIAVLAGCKSNGTPNADLTHLVYSPDADTLLVLRAVAGTQDPEFELLSSDVVTGVYTPLANIRLPNLWPIFAFPALPTGSAIDRVTNQLLFIVPSIGLIGVDLGSYQARIISAAGDLALGPTLGGVADIVIDPNQRRVLAITNEPELNSSKTHRLFSIDLATGLREQLFVSAIEAAQAPESAPESMCCDALEIVDGSLYVVSREIFYRVELLTGNKTVLQDNFPLHMRMVAVPGQAQLLFTNSKNHSILTYDIGSDVLSKKVSTASPLATLLPGVASGIELTGRVTFAAQHGLYVVAHHAASDADRLYRVDVSSGTLQAHGP